VPKNLISISLQIQGLQQTSLEGLFSGLKGGDDCGQEEKEKGRQEKKVNASQ